MILTHLVMFGFFPGAGNSTVIPPVVVEATGGGGGKRKKPFKSYDQRQRERLEAIAAQTVKNQFGSLPKALQKELAPEYKRLSPATVRAYQNARAHDDEEAMAIIAGLL